MWQGGNLSIDIESAYDALLESKMFRNRLLETQPLLNFFSQERYWTKFSILYREVQKVINMAPTPLALVDDYSASAQAKYIDAFSSTNICLASQGIRFYRMTPH